jgi:hypothetical protein
MTLPHRDPSPDVDEPAAQQEREIEDIRGNLGDLLLELGRRRHMLAPRVLIRAHPTTAAALGIAVIAGVGGGIWWHYRRVGRQTTLADRLSRLGSALRPSTAARDRVSRTPSSIGGRILLTVSTAVSVSLARQLVKRYLNRLN